MATPRRRPPHAHDTSHRAVHTRFARFGVDAAPASDDEGQHTEEEEDNEEDEGEEEGELEEDDE